MKLKSTMKHRHLKKKVSLFIYSLIVVLSIIKPLKVSANNACIYEGTYGDIKYSIVEGRRYEVIKTSSSNTGKTVIETITHYDFLFDGLVNAQIYVNIAYLNYPRESVYNIINATTESFSLNSNGIGFYLIVRGQQQCSFDVHNYTEYTGNTNNAWDNFAFIYPQMSNHQWYTGTRLTRSEIVTLQSIETACVNISAYVDQLETLLGGINTDMSYVRSSLNDIYNRAGYIVNQLTDIKNNSDTSNSLLTDIKTILNNMDFTTTPTEQTELQTFNTQNQTVQNIQSNLVNHLTDTIEGTRTMPEYLQYMLVNTRDLQSYNLLNTLYSAINLPSFTSGTFVQILRLIFMFVIIGVILG